MFYVCLLGQDSIFLSLSFLFDLLFFPSSLSFCTAISDFWPLFPSFSDVGSNDDILVVSFSPSQSFYALHVEALLHSPKRFLKWPYYSVFILSLSGLEASYGSEDAAFFA
jgi:hypothetical protein